MFATGLYRKIAKHISIRLFPDIPYNKVGLLLGTSPKLKSGKANLYFDYRIKAATELYNAGKVKYILVSGDNRKTVITNRKK